MRAVLNVWRLPQSTKTPDAKWHAALLRISFALEALVLLWAGILRAEQASLPARRGLRIAGICMFLFALAPQPLIVALLVLLQTISRARSPWPA